MLESSDVLCCFVSFSFSHGVLTGILILIASVSGHCILTFKAHKYDNESLRQSGYQVHREHMQSIKIQRKYLEHQKRSFCTGQDRNDHQMFEYDYFCECEIMVLV